MRPKTPDNAFEGGGLFAKLGAHEQRTRQLQDQRKKEYNDILRGEGVSNKRAVADAPFAAGRNATDAQKMEQRKDRRRHGNSGAEGNNSNFGDDDDDGDRRRLSDDK